MSNKGARLLELDGLRGFAAFSVFLSHVVGLYPDSSLIQALQRSPLHVLFDGAAAVFLFFTLSGFVLALPFVTSRGNLDYVSFIIRRAFRLYPAFWLALTVALIMRAMYHPAGMIGLSDWARSLWRSPVTVPELLRHLTMVLLGDTGAIDPPVWSLATEMRASIILPFFIVWMVHWRTPLSQMLLLLCSVLIMRVSNAVGYLPVFIFGVLAAVNYPRCSFVFNRLSASYRIILWCVALAIYGSPHLFGFRTAAFLLPYVTAVATVLLIFLASTGTRSKGFLGSRLGIFLGETSYSFYLLHFPVLWLLTSYLFPITGSVMAPAAIAGVLTYLLSFVVYRMVEVPLHQLGRTVSLRVRPQTKLQRA